MSKIVLSKWNFLFLLIWGLFLTFCLHIYLSFLQPAKLIPLVEEAVESISPLAIDIQDIDIHFFPHLAVSLENVTIDYNENNIEIESQTQSIRIEFAWTSLLKGEPILSALDFNTAKIRIDSEVSPQEDIELAIDFLESYEQIPQNIRNVEINANNTTLDLLFTTSEDVIHYTFEDFDVSTHAFTDIRLYFENPDIVSLLSPIFTNEQVQTYEGVSFQNIELILSDISFESESLTANTEVKGHINLLGTSWQNTVHTRGTIGLSHTFDLLPFTQETEILTRFVLPSQNIDTRLLFTFNFNDFEDIYFTDGAFSAEDNALTFSAKLEELLPSPQLTASVDLQKLSLTRWFSFARSLTPTLSNILDDISGNFDAYISVDGISSNNLTVYIQDYIFKGEALYTFMDGQALDIRAEADFIDLDTVFPETLGLETQAINYSQNTIDNDIELTENSESKFLYTVDLSAVTATYLNFEAENVLTLIQSDENGVEIPVEIGNIADGTVEAIINLGNGLAIEGDVNDVSLAELKQMLGIDIPIDGVLRGSVDVYDDNENIAQAFAHLTGEVYANISHGSFLGENEERAFHNLSLNANITDNTATERASLRNLEGTYSLTAEFENASAQLSLANALVAYDFITMLPDTIISNSAELALNTYSPIALQTKSKGLFSLNFSDESIHYSSFSGTAQNLSFAGNVTLNSFNNTQISGNIDILSRNFEQILNDAGIHFSPLKDDTALGYIELELPFIYENSVFSAQRFSLQVDDTHIEGDFIHSMGNASQLHIHANSLNLDRYITPLTPPQSTIPFSSSGEIPLRFLSELNIHGTVNIDEFWLYKIPFTNVSVPYSFIGGNIKLTPSASFSGAGSIAVDLQGKTYQDFLMLNTHIKANGVDMLSLTRGRGQSTHIAGTASLDGQVSHVLSDYSDLLESMDGSVLMYMQHGYFVSATPSPQSNYALPPLPSMQNPQSEPSYFSNLSLSGRIENGVLSSQDLHLSGDVSLYGDLLIDLPQWYLTLDADVSYENMPTIPINVSGSLSDPTLSVKVFQAIGNALLSITGGVMNMFTEIITAPLLMLPQ